MNFTYLGTGMKFPPQINPATGRFMTVSDEESVKESIYLILMTQKRERFMRPSFGSDILSYAFMDTSTTALNLIKQEITSNILSQEPRVEDVGITIDDKQQAGCLMIYIDYVLKADHSSGSMVFPFYLTQEPKEEEEAYETMVQSETE